MFRANARRLGSTFAASVPCPTAEQAARHLLMLMQADGYHGGDHEALEQLKTGKALKHKGFEYQVTGGDEA